MKKKSLKTLRLGKQKLSRLTNNKIGGGVTTNSDFLSCNPNPSSYPLNCEPTPSEVSLCTISKLPRCPIQ